MGYDNGRVYDECEDRDVLPIIPLRETPAVKAGKAGPPTYEHGVLALRRVGLQARGVEVALSHGRVLAREPVGCRRPPPPARASRGSPVAQAHRGRAAVEREFGRLKHEWALAPLRSVVGRRSRFMPT